MENIKINITINPSVPDNLIIARSVPVVPPAIIEVEITPTGATNGFINAGLTNLSSSMHYTFVVQQETTGTWNLDSVRLDFVSSYWNVHMQH